MYYITTYFMRFYVMLYFVYKREKTINNQHLLCCFCIPPADQEYRKNI